MPAPAAAGPELERVAHASSLGVYVLGVVAVSTLWGLRLGAPTAVASVLVWDYFYTVPQGSLLVIHTRDWLTLIPFLAVALLASWVANLARRRALEADARRREADARRREADLATELARLLLRTQDLCSALPAAAQCLAQTLELPCAAIELDTVLGDEHQAALPLHDGGTRLGTLLVPADLAEPAQRLLRERIVPSVEALLRAAWGRQATGGAREASRTGSTRRATSRVATRGHTRRPRCRPQPALRGGGRRDGADTASGRHRDPSLRDRRRVHRGRLLDS